MLTKRVRLTGRIMNKVHRTNTLAKPSTAPLLLHERHLCPNRSACLRNPVSCLARAEAVAHSGKSFSHRFNRQRQLLNSSLREKAGHLGSHQAKARKDQLGICRPVKPCGGSIPTLWSECKLPHICIPSLFEISTNLAIRILICYAWKTLPIRV